MIFLLPEYKCCDWKSKTQYGKQNWKFYKDVERTAKEKKSERVPEIANNDKPTGKTVKHIWGPNLVWTFFFLPSTSQLKKEVMYSGTYDSLCVIFKPLN